MSLQKSMNIIKLCHVAESKVDIIKLGKRNHLTDYATEIESFIGSGFKFEDMRFVNCDQSIGSNVDLRTLMNKGNLAFERMYLKDGNLIKPTPTNENIILRQPLEFVIMKDKQVYDRFEMEDATTSTTILGIYKYLCQTIKGNWSVLAMHIDEYGTTPELFRNERMDLSSESNAFLLYKIGQFDGNNNIIVTIRDDSYKAVYNTNKSLVTVNVHIYNTQIKMPIKGESLRVRVTDHYKSTFHVSCSSSAIVMDILKHICYRAGYAPEMVKFTYGGKKLGLKRRISDYNIHQNDELLIEPSMKGGAPSLVPVHTVDVTQKVTIERQWSPSAPRWRVVKHGLVVEGMCRNQNCEAFEKQVCCSLGFTHINLISQQEKLVCPLCSTQIHLKEIALNNCFYTVYSKKLGVSQSLSAVWCMKAGDAYTLFDKEKCGEATFLRLTIKTRRIRPGEENFGASIPDRCSFCNRSLEFQDVYQLACLHSFHKDCILKANQGQKLEICPTCNTLDLDVTVIPH